MLFAHAQRDAGHAATAQTVCSDILGGKSPAEVESLTTKEFTNGSYTPSPEESKAIDATITAYFCR